MVLLGIDSVKDQSWAKAAHAPLYPSSRPRVCFSQDEVFAEAGELRWLCATSPLRILPALGAGPTLRQLLAHQGYYLSSLLCNTLRTLAEHKSVQVVSYDVNNADVLFVFRPSLATCHWVLWFTWAWRTTCKFSGQFWSITLNLGACFPFKFLLPFSWQAFPRLAAEWKECGEIFFWASLKFLISRWGFFLAWVLSSFSAAVSLIAAS